MINHYALDQDHYGSLIEDLREHRQKGDPDVFYALMDFNQSIQLPADTCLRTCRRPAKESWYGAMAYKPLHSDVCLGEAEYNPFAFDVLMLGNMFRFHFTVSRNRSPSSQGLIRSGFRLWFPLCQRWRPYSTE